MFLNIFWFKFRKSATSGHESDLQMPISTLGKIQTV